MKKILWPVAIVIAAAFCVAATLDVWLLQEVITPDSGNDVLALVKSPGGSGSGRKIKVGNIVPKPLDAGQTGEVWIAMRTDSLTGDGTQRNPFDGSTQPKFDTLMAALDSSFGSKPLVINFVFPPVPFPSAFQTNPLTRSWRLHSNWKLRGPGMDTVVIKNADNVNLAGIHYGFPVLGGAYNVPIDYCEIDGITVDTNWPVIGATADDGAGTVTLTDGGLTNGSNVLISAQMSPCCGLTTNGGFVNSDIFRSVSATGLASGTRITAIPQTTIASGSDGKTFPANTGTIGGTINVASTANFASAGMLLYVDQNDLVQNITYTGKTSNSFTGCTGGATPTTMWSSTVTISIATPAVVTWTNHRVSTNDVVTFSTTGALPTGITAGTHYYVVNPGSNTFQIAATPFGTPINTTGTQSGTHTGNRINAGKLSAGNPITTLTQAILSNTYTGITTTTASVTVGGEKNAVLSAIGFIGGSHNRLKNGHSIHDYGTSQNGGECFVNRLDTPVNADARDNIISNWLTDQTCSSYSNPYSMSGYDGSGSTGYAGVHYMHDAKLLNSRAYGRNNGTKLTGYTSGGFNFGDLVNFTEEGNKFVDCTIAYTDSGLVRDGRIVNNECIRADTGLAIRNNEIENVIIENNKIDVQQRGGNFESIGVWLNPQVTNGADSADATINRNTFSLSPGGNGNGIVEPINVNPMTKGIVSNNVFDDSVARLAFNGGTVMSRIPPSFVAYNNRTTSGHLVAFLNESLPLSRNNSIYGSLKVTATTNATGIDARWSVSKIGGGNITIAAGDKIRCEIMADTHNTAMTSGGITSVVGGRLAAFTSASGEYTTNDADGNFGTYGSPGANGQWFYREIDISAVAGNTVDRLIIGAPLSDNPAPAGTFTYFYRNAEIVDANGATKASFITPDTTPTVADWNFGGTVTSHTATWVTGGGGGGGGGAPPAGATGSIQNNAGGGSFGSYGFGPWFGNDGTNVFVKSNRIHVAEAATISIPLGDGIERDTTASGTLNTISLSGTADASHFKESVLALVVSSGPQTINLSQAVRRVQSTGNTTTSIVCGNGNHELSWVSRLSGAGATREYWLLDDCDDVRQTFSNADVTANNGISQLAQVATMTAPHIVTLPLAASYPNGGRFPITDESCTVSPTNYLRLTRSGSDTINGGTTLDITTACANVFLQSDGVGKWTINPAATGGGGGGGLGDPGANGVMKRTSINVTAATGALDIVTKFKSADTTRASTTSISADPDLQFNVNSGEVWQIHFVIHSQNGSTSGGFKWGFGLPAADYGTLTGFYSNTASTTLAQIDNNTSGSLPTSGVATNQVDVGNSNNVDVAGDFMLHATASGSWSFQWSQSASSSSGTIVKAGSYLTAVRMQ